ncbi:hypothetical protein GF406_21925 [candidate division KSB1 bacterium]|nr:hypothetical protein [candidate division KSB1 bacterium]
MPILINQHTLSTFIKKLPSVGLLLGVALLFGFLIMVSRGWILCILVLASILQFKRPSKFMMSLLAVLFFITSINLYLYVSAPVMPPLGTWQNFLIEQLQHWWQTMVLFFPVNVMYWLSAFILAIPVAYIKPNRSPGFLESLDNVFFEPVLFILHQWARRWNRQMQFLGLQLIFSFLLWFLSFQLLGIPASLVVAAFSACAMLAPHIGFWLALLPPLLIVLPGSSSYWQLIGLAITAAVMWILQYLVIDDLDPQFIAWHPAWEALAILGGFFAAGLWGMVFIVPLITLTRIVIDPLVSAYHYYFSDSF